MTAPTASTPERPGDATIGERTTRVSDETLLAYNTHTGKADEKHLRLETALARDLRDLRAASAAREAEIARLMEAKAEGRREGQREMRERAAVLIDMPVLSELIRALPIDGDTP